MAIIACCAASNPALTQGPAQLAAVQSNLHKQLRAATEKLHVRKQKVGGPTSQPTSVEGGVLPCCSALDICSQLGACGHRYDSPLLSTKSAIAALLPVRQVRATATVVDPKKAKAEQERAEAERIRVRRGLGKQGAGVLGSA